MSVKNVENITLSETKRKIKIIRNNIFNKIRRKSMNTMKNMLRTELKQMLIFV